MAGPVHITAPRVSSSISSLDLNTGNVLRLSTLSHGFTNEPDIANVSAEYFDFHASYEVRPAGAKGLGVYSREDLLPGSHVLTDSPVLVCILRWEGENFQKPIGRVQQVGRYRQRSMGLTGRLFCLRRSSVGQNSGPMHSTLAVLDMPFINHGSRFNHSCAPNCSITIFDDKLIVITRERVFEGQELTIQYDSDKSEELLEGANGV